MTKLLSILACVGTCLASPAVLRGIPICNDLNADGVPILRNVHGRLVQCRHPKTSAPTLPPSTPVPAPACRTESSHLFPGSSCVFPFTFKGVTYNSCTADHEPTGSAWCSTRTDAGNNHIAGVGAWGYCQPQCPGFVARKVSGAGRQCYQQSAGKMVDHGQEVTSNHASSFGRKCVCNDRRWQCKETTGEHTTTTAATSYSEATTERPQCNNLTTGDVVRCSHRYIGVQKCEVLAMTAAAEPQLLKLRYLGYGKRFDQWVKMPTEGRRSRAITCEWPKDEVGILSRGDNTEAQAIAGLSEHSTGAPAV